MPRDYHSASSINVYKQCPRKYYYQYIKELPTKKSIHLIRGNIVHSVLEEFFKIDINEISKENFDFELRMVTLDLLKKHWLDKKGDIFEVVSPKEKIGFYFEETREMIGCWINDLLDKLEPDNLVESFNKLKPKTEVEVVSDKYKVRGYIDAVFDEEGIILDYKTSNKDYITEEYKLQLAIYSLLFYEKYGKMPSKAGINFLRFGEEYILVDKELIEFAKNEVKKIHKLTQSNEIGDYPKCQGPLCKWGSGECEFYQICIGEDMKNNQKLNKF
ncbi:MAG: PD-(D/E)XK nuclease family protein [Candidatus Nanoarchaeia archaeon]|nr:PD-(D/E)XK nuclease family protein [Candidatus Nanoarchaeia archaeon]